MAGILREIVGVWWRRLCSRGRSCGEERRRERQRKKWGFERGDAVVMIVRMEVWMGLMFTFSE